MERPGRYRTPIWRNKEKWQNRLDCYLVSVGGEQTLERIPGYDEGGGSLQEPRLLHPEQGRKLLTRHQVDRGFAVDWNPCMSAVKLLAGGGYWIVHSVQHLLPAGGGWPRCWSRSCNSHNIAVRVARQILTSCCKVSVEPSAALRTATVCNDLPVTSVGTNTGCPSYLFPLGFWCFYPLKCFSEKK